MLQRERARLNIDGWVGKTLNQIIAELSLLTCEGFETALFCGELNGDCVITATDALIVLQIGVGSRQGSLSSPVRCRKRPRSPIMFTERLSAAPKRRFVFAGNGSSVPSALAEITARFHRGDAAAAAEADFRQRFQEHALPDRIPEFRWPGTDASVWICRLLTEAELGGATLAKSKGEVRRLIAQGGVKIDGIRVTDPDSEVEAELSARTGRQEAARAGDFCCRSLGWDWPDAAPRFASINAPEHAQRRC